VTPQEGRTTTTEGKFAVNNSLKRLTAILCVTGFITTPVMAASNANNKLEKMSAQLVSMQAEINQLKNEQHPASKHHGRHYHFAGRHHTHDGKVATTNPTVASETSSKVLPELIDEEQEYLPFDLDVPGQAFVSTGPYVGVPIQFAGNNLVVNSPSVNTDVILLGIRKKISEQLQLMHGEIAKEPFHSHLLLSGTVEGRADYFNYGGSPSRTDVNVTNVSLDAIFLGPSEWTMGFIEFSYDDDAPANTVFTTTNQYRVANSRVFINKAFITIGDLSLSPIYGSLGQYYVPFGTYSSSMISPTFTKVLTRTKARALLIGLQQQAKNAFYGSIYAFRGDSHAASVSKINNGGINVGYKFDLDFVNGNFGGGVLANIADSGGMQLGNGFATNAATEQLVHRVPGYNIRGMLDIGQHFDLMAEYVGASTTFNPGDMSYNNHGAKPWATNLEAAFSFSLWDRPNSIGIGYQKSNEALSLGIPLTRYAVVFNTSVWRNTLQSLELRHDREYAASDVATGAGYIASTPETGKCDNAVIAQFDYYF